MASIVPIPSAQCQTCPRKAAFTCGDCRAAGYCSRECQRVNWPVHKKDCAHSAIIAALAAKIVGNIVIYAAHNPASGVIVDVMEPVDRAADEGAHFVHLSSSGAAGIIMFRFTDLTRERSLKADAQTLTAGLKWPPPGNTWSILIDM